MSLSTENRPPLSPRRILLVEDEPLVAEIVQKMLAVDGHTADIARNGEEALTMFSGASYDLVITDFKLGGMDGLELAEAVRKRAPAIHIILITAYAEKLSGMGELSNIDRVLSKPVSIRELHDAVRQAG